MMLIIKAENTVAGVERHIWPSNRLTGTVFVHSNIEWHTIERINPTLLQEKSFIEAKIFL
jgi:hypothetical protein